jgi:hypothetical protein
MGQITGNSSADTKIKKDRKWKEKKWERCRSNGDMRAALHRQKAGISDGNRRDAIQVQINQMSART